MSEHIEYKPTLLRRGPPRLARRGWHIKILHKETERNTHDFHSQTIGMRFGLCCFAYPPLRSVGRRNDSSHGASSWICDSMVWFISDPYSLPQTWMGIGVPRSKHMETISFIVIRIAAVLGLLAGIAASLLCMFTGFWFMREVDGPLGWFIVCVGLLFACWFVYLLAIVVGSLYEYITLRRNPSHGQLVNNTNVVQEGRFNGLQH